MGREQKSSKRSGAMSPAVSGGSDRLSAPDNGKAKQLRQTEARRVLRETSNMSAGHGGDYSDN